MRHRLDKLLALTVALLLALTALAIAEEASNGFDAGALPEAAEQEEIERAASVEPAFEETEVALDDVPEAGEALPEPEADAPSADPEPTETASDTEEHPEAEAVPETEDSPETEDAPAAEAVPEEEEIFETEEAPDTEEASEAEAMPEPEEIAEAEERPEAEEDPEAASDAPVIRPVGNALTYTGEPQALVSEEGVPQQALIYSLDGVEYAAESPSAIDAGDYVVYFMAADDPGAEPQTLVVTIAKADVTFTAPIAMTGEA